MIPVITGCTSLLRVAIPGTKPHGLMVRGLPAMVLSGVLVLAGCGPEESDPAADQTPAESSSPEAEETSTGPEPRVIQETLTPEECSFPAVQISGKSPFPLKHGTVERSQIQGVSLLLTTATPTDDPAELEITRRVVGCAGSATVQVPADQTVSTLGLTLQVTKVRTAIDVPNRAAVTVTVVEDEE